MQIGFIGLGRMGKAMVLHLLEQGVDVVVYNRTKGKTDELKNVIPSVNEGSLEIESSDMLRDPSTSSRLDRDSAQDDTSSFGKLIPTYTIGDLINKLSSPRVIWLMVPHGVPVDEMIAQLVGDYPKVSREIHLRGGLDRTPLVKLTSGDVIIDGGNSFYKDSIRRFELLKKKGIHYLDIGTSGGLEGARNGACLMVGGDRTIYNEVRPRLEAMAKPKGNVTYFGPAGAGHFVKMVHNGVEYGMLQAIGEGFEMLEKGMPVTKPFARVPLAKTVKLDFHKVAFNWTHGSVVRGWLMDLLERALKTDPKLENIEGVVGGGSTGEWAVATAKELKVEIPVIKGSLKARKKSYEKPTFSGKVVATLRNQFGGHEVKKVKS